MALGLLAAGCFSDGASLRITAPPAESRFRAEQSDAFLRSFDAVATELGLQRQRPATRTLVRDASEIREVAYGIREGRVEFAMVLREGPCGVVVGWHPLHGDPSTGLARRSFTRFRDELERHGVLSGNALERHGKSYRRVRLRWPPKFDCERERWEDSR